MPIPAIRHRDSVSFADAVSQQAELSVAGFAPKFITTPEYSFVNNYGYHLDAGKPQPITATSSWHRKSRVCAMLLITSCQWKKRDDGDIAAIVTTENGQQKSIYLLIVLGNSHCCLGNTYKYHFYRNIRCCLMTEP
ncbi:MAG: hypothetical protein U5L01_07780 [Rheinheimera sp.]|nr:hypothetical protein [Rheinheimera sp.]